MEIKVDLSEQEHQDRAVMAEMDLEECHLMKRAAAAVAQVK